MCACVFGEGLEVLTLSTFIISSECWPLFGQNLCFNKPCHLPSPMILLTCKSFKPLRRQFSSTLLPSFPFYLALIKTHQIYWLSCLGIPDLWRFNRGIILETYKAHGLWWALNSSSAVSADILAQKGKKNKLDRAWFCWEHYWESWEGQGVLGSKTNREGGTRTEPLGTGPLSVIVGCQWLPQLRWLKATWFGMAVICRCHSVSMKLNWAPLQFPFGLPPNSFYLKSGYENLDAIVGEVEGAMKGVTLNHLFIQW